MTGSPALRIGPGGPTRVLDRTGKAVRYRTIAAGGPDPAPRLLVLRAP